MTRLSLHYDGENPNLSIHLREGQYCTVGSSAAADYSFRADGVEPLHCRIGCQTSGAYIECFDVFDSITINTVRKSRSRLSNGDELRIGNVEFRVEMPIPKNKLANFAVEFGSEETPSTQVAQALKLERVKDDDENSVSDAIEPQSAEEPSPPDSPSASKPLIQEFDLFEDDDEDEEFVMRDTAPAHSDPPVQSDPPIQTDPPVQTEPPVRTDPPVHSDETTRERPNESGKRSPPPTRPRTRSSRDDSRPQFEFDSAEPGDLELTHAEFEELSNQDAEHVTIGGVDLESALTESGSGKPTDDIQLGDSEPEDNELEESGQVFRGGAFLHKYWRWNGKSAVSVLQKLLDSPEPTKIYRSNVNQITIDSFEEVSLSGLKQQQPAVFLISSMDLSDLQQLIRQKRWSERIGHPQAVTMFLTFLPKRLLRDFFEAIDTCVLVHENDVELLRIRKTY